MTNAWKKACASPTPSELLIPKGTFKLARVTLEGPCKAPIKINLQATLQAPSDPTGFKDGDGWVTFEHIDRLTLMGGGIFDGQGKAVWGKHCAQGQYCSKLPIVSFLLISRKMLCIYAYVNNHSFGEFIMNVNRMSDSIMSQIP